MGPPALSYISVAFQSGAKIQVDCSRRSKSLLAQTRLQFMQIYLMAGGMGSSAQLIRVRGLNNAAVYLDKITRSSPGSDFNFGVSLKGSSSSGAKPIQYRRRVMISLGATEIPIICLHA